MAMPLAQLNSVRYDKGVRNCSQEPDRSQFLQKVVSGECAVAKITLCSDSSDLDCKYEGPRSVYNNLTVSFFSAAKSVIDALAFNSPLPFKVTRAIPWIFEAIPPTVHKGYALLRICKMLGVTPDQVLAFGDGENDIDMFHATAYSVAMENAMPAAVAAAKYTTTSNNEGGVGRFIAQVWDL